MCAQEKRKLENKRSEREERLAAAKARAGPYVTNSAVVPPSLRPAAKPSSALDESNLHPSWQAKRQADKTMASFAGSKIVFD